MSRIITIAHFGSPSKDLAKTFKEHEPRFRIEAVIHDGQWWTVDKWAKLAKVSKEDIGQFIPSVDYLINQDDSYRVTGREVLRWYEDKGLDIAKPIVPGNFPPRVWHGYSEQEWFLKCPRRFVSCVTVTTKNYDLQVKIRRVLSGYCIAQESLYKDSIRIYSLSEAYIHKLLHQFLTPSDWKQIQTRTRIGVHWRDMTDFPSDVVEHFFGFYIDYAKTALKGHMKTLNVFLRAEEDVESQIYDWICMATQRYDEKSCAPFAGFLTQVLQFWPYDLPVNALGKQLADFQRERQRIVDRLIADEVITDLHVFDEDMIYEELKEKYTRDDYYKLALDHFRWESLNDPESMTVVGSDGRLLEKVGEIFIGSHTGSSTEEWFQKKLDKHLLGKMILTVGAETKEYDNMLQMLDYISGRVKVFDDAFYYKLKKVLNEARNKE